MNLSITILVAFGFFLLAMALIGIGWLITGKMRCRIGRCGKKPGDKNDKKCGLCDEEKKDDLQ